jgi:Flp pilus assembly protein TadD
MGIQLARQGKLDDAIVCFREAVRLDPRFSEFHSSLALALSGRGEFREATEHYQEAIRLNANDPRPCNNLAWIRATHPDSKLRNGPEAVLLAERANELSERRDPGLLDTLAAAYAEAGRFPEAIATVREGISLAVSAGSKALAQELEKRQELYEQEKPYREIQVPRKEGER